ncbi:MAG: hypothetical protein ACRDKY_10325 [Solirubrobacteraceae bacterium]
MVLISTENDRIARTTGSNPIPEATRRRGYRHVADKFTEAGLTPVDADLVEPPRVAECPVQMEATLRDVHAVGPRGGAVAVEVAVERVHATRTSCRARSHRSRCLATAHHELSAVLRLSRHRLRRSELARIPEASYR